MSPSHLIRASVASAIAAASFSIHAQQAPAGGEDELVELEEITVTASKRESGIQDLSAAVSAVNMDRLLDAQIGGGELGLGAADIGTALEQPRRQPRRQLRHAGCRLDRRAARDLRRENGAR